MEASQGNAGINQLAKTISHRVSASIAGSSKTALELGRIQSDYGLLTDTYPIPIPQSDYLVCRQLTLGPAGNALCSTADGGGSHAHSGGTHGGHESGTGAHDHDGGGHAHTALIPEKMRWLMPGDRVLVAWVHNDAVVIDVVVPASTIGG